MNEEEKKQAMEPGKPAKTEKTAKTTAKKTTAKKTDDAAAEKTTKTTVKKTTARKTETAEKTAKPAPKKAAPKKTETTEKAAKPAVKKTVAKKDEAAVEKTAKAAPKKAAPKKEEAPAKQETKPAAKAEAAPAPAPSQSKKVTLESPIIMRTLADAIGRKPNEIITALMQFGELASINQPVSDANAKKLCEKFGFELEIGARPEKPAAPAPAVPQPAKAKAAPAPIVLEERPPVVTFMGHVDHGKTSLQDAVRHTHVVDKEAGRITQHIGASTIKYQGKTITFIDTPGHEAFTSMRARGANVTDIAVLVVAASEGFKEQTVEALNHALAAKVTVIVAMNKIDLPDADPDKVLRQMQQYNIPSEDWGGTVAAVRVSAKTGEGLDELLDRILLEAEMLELKASPRNEVDAVVLEAQMEQGLGSTASVLVQDGTLRVGDIALCGESYGKIRSLISDKGERVKSAGPSTPVKLVGLNSVPSAGDKLTIVASEKIARQEVEQRIAEKRSSIAAKAPSMLTADDLFSKLSSDELQTLNLVIKSDVRGSGEAIEQSLAKLPRDKVKSEVLMNAVGAITENDVMLAAASQAIIVGFHVRVNPGVNDLAKRQGVEIRLYSVIYELLEDITDALTGKLEPEKRETTLGQAKILQIFELTKGPKICGCLVESGLVRNNAKVRVLRNGELIYTGAVAGLKRFKDDVKEVKSGLECGIRLDNFADFEPGDIVEFFEIELKKATL
ncbi:MAG: translation initiation factor IF-2 [Lentisphaeria bacterium]|nr:translation initiation factor IF-2 [Lentisphaeria bacterium]